MKKRRAGAPGRIQTRLSDRSSMRRRKPMAGGRFRSCGQAESG